MGAWNELDTEFSAELDLKDLDQLINLDSPYGIFDEVKKDAEHLKQSIEEGMSNGLKNLAERNRSFQEQIIRDTCERPSGRLATSINIEEYGKYQFVTGTDLPLIYPLCLEKGRGPIVPVNAKALAFYADSGELIFRKRVGEAKPRPFVAPAYDKTIQLVDSIILGEIGNVFDNG